jgi:hypothetical protein
LPGRTCKKKRVKIEGKSAEVIENKYRKNVNFELEQKSLITNELKISSNYVAEK